VISFVSYFIEKRIARRQERFGKRAVEGIGKPEAADNNSVTFGFLVLAIRARRAKLVE